MRSCTNQYIQKIKSYSERIEEPHYECHTENRISLIQENEEHFPKAAYRFSGSDIKPSFKKAVGEFEKRLTESQKYTDKEIKGDRIFVILIEKIQILKCTARAGKAPKDRKKRIEKNISEHAFPGLVITEKPLAVKKILTEIYWLSYRL